MPPIPTEQTSASSAVKVDKMWLKPIPKGLPSASFRSSKNDWDDQYKKLIGISTKTIKFGRGFVLTDTHIDQILGIGKVVRQNFQRLIFDYGDVSYSAHNSAESLTTEAVVRLAKACPSLKTLHLPSASNVGDEGLLALFENCPALISLEITEASRTGESRVSEKTIDQLRENPEWVPKLKFLIISKTDKKRVFLKAVRDLTKERKGLIVKLVDRHEYKKWDDWELSSITAGYRNGRLASDLH